VCWGSESEEREIDDLLRNGLDDLEVPEFHAF
jgi:hypothetical protein